MFFFFPLFQNFERVRAALLELVRHTIWNCFPPNSIFRMVPHYPGITPPFRNLIAIGFLIGNLVYEIVILFFFFSWFMAYYFHPYFNGNVALFIVMVMIYVHEHLSYFEFWVVVVGYL